MVWLKWLIIIHVFQTKKKLHLPQAVTKAHAPSLFLQLGASKTENSSRVSVSHTNITELVFMHATEETSMHFMHKPRVHSVFQNFTLQVFKR